MAIWKDISQLILIQLLFLKTIFGLIARERIFGTWGTNMNTNIWLPDSMVGSTKLWHHQNMFIQFIMYIFIYRSMLLKYIQTQVRCQAPGLKVIIKKYEHIYRGTPLTVKTLNTLSWWIEILCWKTNPTNFVTKPENHKIKETY